MRKLVLLLVGLVGCGSGTEPTLTHVGSWHVATLDGRAVPVTVVEATPTQCGMTVEGGGVVLRSDNTYTLTIEYGGCGGQSQYVGSGNYTVDGQTIRVFNAGPPITMAFTGKALEWQSTDGLYSFRK